MLRANRRLLRPGGHLALLVIETGRGLAPADRRRAADIGPPFVGSRSDVASMMRSAGFVDIECVDLTDQYRETAAAWHHQYAEHAAELEELVGREVLAEKYSGRSGTLAAIDDGLLRRVLCTGRRRN